MLPSNRHKPTNTRVLRQIYLIQYSLPTRNLQQANSPSSVGNQPAPHPTNPMNYKWIALFSAGYGLLTPATYANLIVDFTSSPASVVSAAGKDVDTNGVDIWTFDDTSPLFDGTSTGTNTRILGGVTTSWSTDVAYNPPVQLLTNGRLYLANNGSSAGSANTSIQAILIWQKVDFLNGADAATLGFSSGDSLSINWTQITADVVDMRFVVQQGGTYYVSSAVQNAQVTNNSPAGGVAFSIDPTTTDWAEISPNLNYNYGPFGSLTFSDIESVGIYLGASRAMQQTIISFNDFQATATVVPEPSVFAALVGFGALGFIALRRRCRR
jgi:hypothetical protein